jgi:LacI family transcriptional regulator
VHSVKQRASRPTETPEAGTLKDAAAAGRRSTEEEGPLSARASIKDVAAAAAVSVGTVSNVLNRPHLVSEQTRDRVNEVIEQLGFVRNESARQLRAGSSRAVGLVVIDAANPFFADVARGVEDTVQEAGGVVLLGNSSGDFQRERRYVELFEEQRVRGLLIAPTGVTPPDLTGFVRRGIPVVFLDRHPDGAPFSTVDVDDVAGGRMAVEHLLAQGHRRLAFVGGPSTLAQVRDRRRGAEDAVSADRRTNAATLLAISTPSLTLRSGREAAEHIVAAPDAARPTGVFAANDLVALGLLQGFAAHGLRVPDDVAIVGYDDIEFAAGAAVPLSSVRQPREDLGRRGAELLYEEIRAREAGEAPEPHHVRFQPELVVRRSTSPKPHRPPGRTARTR